MKHNGLIEIENMQSIIDLDKEDLGSLIKECALAVLNQEKFPHKVLVSIGLVENSYIKKLNKEFRGIDEVTDVLSFPMLDIEPGEAIKQEDDFFYDRDPETGALILGDIMISLEKAKIQGQDYGHSFKREVGFLVVHGMLHLLGYDHIESGDRDRMRKREEGILGKLRIFRD